MDMYAFVILFMYSGLLIVCHCMDTYNNSISLYKYLFKNNRHNPSIVPKCTNNDHVTVYINTAIRELVELNEKFQLVRVKLWVRLQWRDCSLTWSPGDFGGEEGIIVPYGTLWMPDLAMYEGCSDEANMPDMKEYRASIMYNGSVRYHFPTIVTLACRIDVTYFPYDHQNCSLTFSSWMYDQGLVDLQPSSNTGDIKNFIPHNEWQLISMKAHGTTKFYKCCKEPYSQVVYYLILARYPKFYLLTLFFPCIIVSLLSLLGYLLPPVSGEKISLQITVLLTIVVFLLLVQDKLPSSSDTFPYIGIYFSMSMMLVCLSCVMSGVVMYVYYKGSTNESVPPWVKRVFLTGLRRILCVSRSHHLSRDKNNPVVLNKIKPLPERQLSKTFKPFYQESIGIRNGRRLSISCNDIPHYIDENDDDIDDRLGSAKCLITNDWELLAYVLDRFFLLFYVAFTVINICPFFMFIFKEI